MPKELLPYLLAMAVFAVGIYAVAVKRNLIKIIIGLIVADYAVNVFLVLVGYRDGGIAPILTKTMSRGEFVSKAVDPIPQALVLTSIVIGLAVVALTVSLAIRLYEKYGTFDVSEMKKLRG